VDKDRRPCPETKTIRQGGEEAKTEQLGGEGGLGLFRTTGMRKHTVVPFSTLRSGDGDWGN